MTENEVCLMSIIIAVSEWYTHAHTHTRRQEKRLKQDVEFTFVWVKQKLLFCLELHFHRDDFKPLDVSEDPTGTWRSSVLTAKALLIESVLWWFNKCWRGSSRICFFFQSSMLNFGLRKDFRSFFCLPFNCFRRRRRLKLILFCKYHNILCKIKTINRVWLAHI